MWKVLQEVLPWVLLILVISQYIYPILTNTKTWWLFRPERKKVDVKESSETTLVSELQEAKKVVEETKVKVEKIKEKVDEHYKSAEQLKKESSNLL